MNKLNLTNAQQRYNRACNLYNGCFESDIYNRATENLNARQANTLIDCALALCGSPYHAFSRHISWGTEQNAFLSLFTWIA